MNALTQQQLSQTGQAMVERVLTMCRSPEFWTYRLMEAHAVPDPNKLTTPDIERLRQVFTERAVSTEQRMKVMLDAIHMIPRKDESPDDRYFRTSAKTKAMQAMENAVEVSRDPHELAVAAQMFLEQRSIIVKLAQNPYLSEETMLNIAKSPLYKNDHHIGRALAQNHNLTPKAARAIAFNFAKNEFVMNALADHVGKLARSGPDREQFAEVCRELTSLHPINYPMAPAIHGVNDPEHLRALYLQHRNRSTIERNLDHMTYHAIAQNPATPIDVIQSMSKEPPLISMFGKDSRLTEDTISQRLTAFAREEQVKSVKHNPRNDFSPS